MYLFKDNDRNTKKECEISSKLAIKTPERRKADLSLFKKDTLAHVFELF